ncbi:hypothetical protein [Spirillospora sp. NPDC048824]|uniref:hypothetical protein n=1 Tax=Spirillospora sp. NPDC048824 TaxID=3364526 RepID=UPI0037203463
MTGPTTTRAYARRRAPAPRAAVAGAGATAAAAAGPLAAGTVLLLADALGGAVGVPGDVVTYIGLTGLVLACAALPAALWLVRRMPAPGLAAVTGACAALAVAVAGLVPAVPVFATALMAAGLLGGPPLAVARASAARLESPGALARWQAAALAGVAGAAWLASSLSGSPRTALVSAGVVGAVLAVAAVLAPRAQDPAAGDRAAARLRDAVKERDVRAALPAYALTGWAAAVPVAAGLHLLTFRWNLVAEEPVRHLAWGLTAAVALVAVLRRAAASVRAVPWLLLAAAAAPVLMATAPGPARLAAGFAVAAAAGCLAAAALDRAVLRPLPDDRRPAAAALTAVAAVLGGLAGYGCAALLREVIAEGSAVTLTAVPVAAGAVLAARVRGPAVEPSFLDVRALSVRRTPVPLRRIMVRVDAGECVAVFGAGSRTLLAALAGNVPVRGRVRLGGADLAAVPAGRRMRLGLYHLAESVPDTGANAGADADADGRTVAGRLAGHAHTLGHADPAASARAVLEVFPALHRRRTEPAGALGAPDRDLLGLAEALLTRPRLLLADGVADGPRGDAAGTVLRRLAASGTAVVVTGRPVPALLDLVSRAYVLDRGRVVAELARPTPDQVRRLLPGNPDAGDAAP